jgi:hypothetical protein
LTNAIAPILPGLAGSGCWWKGRKLHKVASAQKPINAHVKVIRDLANSIEIERLKPLGFEINHAPAADAYRGVEAVMCEFAGAAGLCEAFAEDAEI